MIDVTSPIDQSFSIFCVETYLCSVQKYLEELKIVNYDY